jgi:2-polyprenyl-3-methyl-5-hydroxy-6-metoxy-1,4-benzoquinol methylase
MIYQSPITKSNNVRIITKISTEELTQKYLNAFKIDVSYLMNDLNEISLLACGDTGYKFYFPHHIAGDSKFYEHFQQYDWYYMPWKWEHEKVAKLIKPGMKILEVGCGSGGFLEGVSKRMPSTSLNGLELNQKAIEDAQKKGINVLRELINEHAESHFETYDLVCSFQVLEHIADVHAFLEAQIKTLKKGGLLTIAVPNNESFARFDRNNDILNMPPHHMGLWTNKSLNRLQRIFPLKCIKQINEPLQPYHFDWYLNILEKRINKTGKPLSSIYKKIKSKKILRKICTYFPWLVTGHTTIAIFKKI